MLRQERRARVAMMLAALVLAVLAAQWGCAAESDEGNEPVRNPNGNAVAVRDELNGLLKLMERASEAETESMRKEYFGALIALRMASHEDKVAYVREVIDFDIAASTAGNEKAGIVASLALDVAPVGKGRILEAVMPYFEKPDEATRRVVNRMLYIVEDSSSAGCWDFSHYRSYIEVTLRAGDRPDSALIEHMFRRSPGQAVQTFAMIVYQDGRRKPFLWARHVVDDALWRRQHGFAPPKEPDAAVTEQLATMAEREEFWARLYAAEIIRQHPEFGTDELAGRLAEDAHPLVAKTAKSIRTPAKVRDE